LAAKKKTLKLFQVAKELKLATSTLSEELEALGYKVTKAQMTPINEDMYGQLLQKFAPEHWANLQDQAAREETDRNEAEALKARQDELQKILETDEPQNSPRKPAPSVRQLHPEDLIQPEDLVKQEQKVAEKARETADAVVKAEEKTKPATPPPPAKKASKSSPSVRGAAEPVKPVQHEKKAEAPAAQDNRKDSGHKPHDKHDKKKSRRGATPSVRGGVSNDDILSFAPAQKQHHKPIPVAEEKKKEDKPKHASPSPHDHSGSSDDDSNKKRKRKRKVSKKKQEGQEQTAPKAKGGWVSTGDSAAGKGGKRKRKRDKKRKKPDAAEVQASIKQTMAAMDEKTKKKRKRHVQQVGMIDEDTNLLQITEFVSTLELASLMDVPVTDLIKECLMLGLRVTINQRLEKETIQILAEEHEYHVEFVDDLEQQNMLGEAQDEIEEEIDDGELEPRAPVVTVMGHVDHGKTSLLDYIRKTRVTEGEAGGITQHIGAYEITHNDQKITFLDTPGHEAFTAMRARGAQVTDVVVLVVAADDQVMPQTVEAIDHAKAADVPMVVAINKMDKPGANAEKVRQQLADKNILVEDWGGDVQTAEVSAKTGKGIPDLLDQIILATEILELQAVRDTQARGYIIESRQEKGKGTVCTVLVQRGTLRIGDVFVAGPHYGRVRAMYDELGQHPKEIGPGQPVLITGFEGTPHVGDQLIVFKDEREAKDISIKRQQQLREQEMRMTEGSGRGDLLQLVDGEEGKRVLNLVIKGDVDGSVEAIADSLMRLSTDEVEVKIIRRGVGPINESDILLASASHAMVIGFNVHPMGKARDMAGLHDVPFNTYRIIYELIEEVKSIIIGMHRVETAEEIVGNAEVRNIFKISRVGTIAGCYVTDGKIERSSKVRVLRDGTEVYAGNLDTLKRFKDDAKEVASGYECGMKVENFNDVKVGDILQAFKIVEVDRQIEVG